MRYFITVVALVLALPAAALAKPSADDSATAAALAQERYYSSYAVDAPVTDLRAPDQQAPAAAPVQALGTDVAAVDQQSPIVRVVEVPAAAPSSSDFSWSDAAIGAAAALGAIALLGAAALTIRRRRTGVAIG